MMEITIRFGAGLSQATGSTRMQVMLAEGAMVADLLERLCDEFPQFTGPLSTAVAVIAGRVVDPSEPLSNGQEVALLTPVSGGCF